MTVQLINIWCTQVTDAGLRQLRPHYGLTHLDLSHCHQITDDGLKQLRGMHILSSGTHRQLVSLYSNGCLATHEKAASYSSLQNDRQSVPQNRLWLRCAKAALSESDLM